MSKEKIAKPEIRQLYRRGPSRPQTHEEIRLGRDAVEEIRREVPLAIHHVMYDGYGGNRARLEDMRGINDLMETLVYGLGLKQVNPPLLFPYFHGKEPEDCGVSALFALAGGHLTIHTFSKKGCVFVDLAFTQPRTSEDAIAQVQATMRSQFNMQRGELFHRGVQRRKARIDQIVKSFGPHMMLDGYLKPDQQNLDFIYDLLAQIPKLIGMTAVTTPIVTKTDESGGWQSGILLIAESHISLHAYKDGQFFFDIFSCKPFDPRAVSRLLKEKGLKYDRKTVSLIARGKDFPRK